ncbi:MAG: hypothetical protein OQK29_01415 [Ignavibacteriaceae bacterium]|nr:hypothetical protein [Ignavibacteriaceae bacterium]
MTNVTRMAMNKEQYKERWKQIARKNSGFAYNFYLNLANDYIDKMQETIQSLADKNGMPFDEAKRLFLNFMFHGLQTKQSRKLREAIRSSVKPLEKPVTLHHTLNH